MTITPTFGMAPLNTLTPIKVEINPSEILKFDARIMVQVRGSKNLELRFGGESEEPMIDINIVKILLVIATRKLANEILNINENNQNNFEKHQVKMWLVSC